MTRPASNLLTVLAPIGGGAVRPSGPIYRPPPTLASGHWTQHNIAAGVTLSDLPNGVHWDIGAQSGIHLRGLLEPPPVTPQWRVNAKWNMNIPKNISAPMVGIMMRDSGTGHVLYFNVHQNAGAMNWALHQANDSDGGGESPVSGSSYAVLAFQVMPWLQVRQTATDWVFEISNDDGQSWLTMWTMPIGTQVANLTGIGPFANPENTSNWNATLEHWGYDTPQWAIGG